ncbi:MAG: polysaccharide biosynthesis tyrosine autokinase [Myxococcota bacterium]|nr:polysaccharide biosynthesis tyrosine autokinase [Myxococcota bacterium]
MSDYPHNIPTTDSDGEDGISIFEYLTILLDEWRTLAIPFVLSVLFAVSYLTLAVPHYTASGVIQVSTSETTDAAALLEITSGRPSPVDTEVEILRSRRIIGQAIEHLSLNIAQPLPRITANLNVSLKGASPLAPELIALRRVIRHLAIEDWVESAIAATLVVDQNCTLTVTLGNEAGAATVTPGSTFKQQGVTFSLAEHCALSPGSMDVLLVPRDIAVDGILNALDVQSVGGGRRDTNLVRISFENEDRTVARDMVNAIMAAYMSFALDWRTLRADRSTSFIEQQIATLAAELNNAEARIQAFAQENGAIMLPEQAKELIKNGAELEFEMRKVKIQEDLLRSIAGNMARSNRRGESPALTGDFLFDDPLLGKAISALNELELKRETLLAEVTPAHPQVVRIGEEIQRVRAQVHDLIKASRNRIGERHKALLTELGSIQDALKEFPEKERNLTALRRNLEVTQGMHQFLLTKLEETRILKASTTTDKRIIDPATTPHRASRPNRKTVVLLAAFLGLLFGVLAVFVRRAIDPKIRDEEEAKVLSGLSTYGVVPDLSPLWSTRGTDQTAQVIWEKPKGPAAEAFRTIRTNVEFAQVGEDPLRVLQVTSSEASEGKSTIISNLAIALSKAGHRVLVLDLDFRRPRLHKIWGVPQMPGLSDHLVGQADIRIHRDETHDLDFIPAGNEPPESQRLLASQKLAGLVDSWREQYDYVLLDTPPFLVADSLVISRMSDAVLFVVRPRYCRRAHLKLARNALDQMDIVKGLIINGVVTRRGGYYHYYRGSYYGSKTSDTQER